MMKCIIGLLALAVPSLVNAAFYLEDDVPNKIVTQLSMVQDQPKPKPAYRYNVPFVAQKYNLGPQGIDSLKTILNEFKNAQTIVIEGRPDANGLNDTDLARRRALAIKKYLQDNGVSERRISIDLQTDVRYSEDSTIFNSTVYTADALNNTPAMKSEYIKQPSIAEKRLNNQPVIATREPTKLTPDPQPILPSSQVIPTSQVIAKATIPDNTIKDQTPKTTKVEGTFNVLRADAIAADKPIKPAIPSSYEFPIDSLFSDESKLAISRYLATNSTPIVIADGSLAGFKKAKEIEGFIKGMTGYSPEIRAKGASKGIVIVKGI